MEMSLPSEQLRHLTDVNVETVNVPDLIFVLRSAFQPKDFSKVEEIIKAKMDRMKSEIDHWKQEYDVMEEKHGSLVLSKLETENELKKYKRECEALKERITQLEEDEKVRGLREKRARSSHEKLLKDFEELERENRELIVKKSELESWRFRAEQELEKSKKRNEEFDMRVTKLEGDMEVLMLKLQEQPISVRYGKVGEEKISAIAEPENGAPIESESGNSKEVGLKKDSLNDHKRGLSLTGAVAVANSSHTGKYLLKNAGPSSVSVACIEEKSQIQNQVVEDSGSSHEKMNTPVVADEVNGLEAVIEINDSDGDMPAKDLSSGVLPKIVAPKGVVEEEEIQETKISSSNIFGDDDDGNQNDSMLLSPLTSSKKRKIESSILVERKDDINGLDFSQLSCSSCGDSDCDSEAIDEFIQKIKA